MIVVVGNIASGKTTFCNIFQKCADYRHSIISLDIERGVFGDGTYLGEDDARKSIIEKASSYVNVIYETTMIGSFHNEVINTYRLNFDNPVRYVFIDTSVKTCLSRANKRIGHSTYPSDWANSVNGMIQGYKINKDYKIFDIVVDGEDGRKSHVSYNLDDIAKFSKVLLS